MNTFRKIGSVVVVMAAVFLFSASVASAHVVVKPNQAGIGAFQTFSMGVPSEKPIATVGLRLLIPTGLSYVTPNVKAGWTITVKKSGTGENAVVTEIDWTGGSIPAGQRDDFAFSAKVPSQPGNLQWKAYQTYQDGSVVAWDHDPVEKITDFSKAGPYSQTAIINDLTTVAPSNSSGATCMFTILSILVAIALVLSVMAYVRAGKKDQR